MKVYLIKACDGIHTDRVFLRPPTEVEMQEVLGQSLVQHGHKNGKPTERSVSYITLEAIGNPEDGPEIAPKVSGKLTLDESAKILKTKSADQPSGHVVTEREGVKFEGVGEVILIEDPRHPRYQAK